MPPLRLLPWTTPTGGPCYLSTDDPSSHLSLLADEVEEDLLMDAEDLLTVSEPLSVTPGADPSELHRMVVLLDKALRDALRIATSRGARLAAPGPDPCDHDETEHCGGKTFCRSCRFQLYL
ncbi:hypothetical protein [Streptomyces sp. NPDC003077]|uniref:hypothetical protein n=1 Tax=Streptomyces sp. NPDC003077 TaxID=3154443 RepID=UPI0033AC1899